MRLLVLLISACLILTSCKGPVKKVDNNMKEKDYISLIKEYKVENNALKNENFELKQKLEEISTKDTDNLLDKSTVESSSQEEIIDIRGYKFRISIKGRRELEDGVILMLEALSNSSEEKWIRVWNQIDISELAIYSEPIVFNEELYIVVDGSLNIINIEDGNLRMLVDNLGKSNLPPLINKDGIVYIIGEYEPYLTAIDTKGSILWQMNDQAFRDISSIEMENDVLVVDLLGGKYRISKDGMVISFTED